MEVKVKRDGKIHEITFEKGVTKEPLKVVGQTDETGTLVHFVPDAEIFDETVYDYDTLRHRLRELSFLNRGITIILTDERPEEVRQETFYFEGGISSFVEHLNRNKEVINPEPVYFNGTKDTTVVEIALQYNTSYSENIYSFVNNINTHEGGTHVSGFRTALTRVINDLGKSTGLIKEKDGKLQGSDIREGLTAIVSVKVPQPQFEGQTKTKLGNSEVTGVVSTVAGAQIKMYLEDAPNDLKVIVEKILNSKKAREAAQRARELVLRKSALDVGSLPGKLADCSSKNSEECEVYIVEGDSAGGSAKGGRDSKHQAILPLWGKMLNVEKARIEQVVDNDKLKPVIQALGTNVGKHFNLEKLRYDKVIIMADADVDGSHIRTLLLAFFFRYMTQLIETGHVYLAMPPLYKIEYKKKHHYAYDDNEKDRILNEIGVSEEENSVKIQRYKGLGEMNPEQLWDTTMNPETRQMMKVTMDDAVEADRIFTVLMGSEVEPRKKFIEENALSVTNLDI